MGRNNQNSKWSTHQQLKSPSQDALIISGTALAGEFDLSDSFVPSEVVEPVVEKSSTEVIPEAPVTKLEPEVKVEAEVVKPDLKPIVKKTNKKS